MLGLLSAGAGHTAAGHPGAGIKLELRPRICILSSQDERCETVVRAQWRSARKESLCLVILERPEVKQCWDHHSSGVYTLELMFDADLTVQLRDPQLREVLASRTLKVIREALQWRRRRRQPWSIFD